MRRYLPYILYAVIVIGLVAAIIFAFSADDPASKTDKKNPSTSSEQQKKNDSGNKTGSQNSGNGSAGSVAERPNPTYTPPASSGSSSSSSSASPAQQNQSQSNTANKPATGSTQQLANTGPGETLAAFVFVSIAGAAAFSAYQRRALVS